MDLTGGLATGHASITFTDPAVQTLGGTGQVYFGAGGTAVGTAGSSLLTKTNGLLTVGPGILMHGQRMSLTGIANQGTVSTDLPGGSITLTTFTNGASGSIFVDDGGTLTLGSGWQNNGTAIVRNGTVAVAGRFPTSQLESVIREGSGTNFVTRTGAGILDNANHVLVADATSPVWKIEGTIIGGTVAANAGGTMTLNNATFDGVHLLGRPTLIGTNGPSLYVVNDLTLESGATIDLSRQLTNGSSLALSIGPFNDFQHVSQTLGGSGEVRLGKSGVIQVQPFHSLTIGPGVMIHGPGGTLAGRFLNQGTIVAEAGSNAEFSLSGPAFTNAGSFRVESGATTSVTVTTFTQTASGITTIDGLLRFFGATPLLGDGLLTGGGTVTVNSGSGTLSVGGAIAPGDSLAGPTSDVLTVSANLTLTGRLAPQAGATATSSLLYVNGNLDLSSTSDYLDLSAFSGLAEGTSFAVAEVSNGIVGVFDHVTPGFTVDYQPHEVVVSVVPEPCGIACLGACAISSSLVLRRRRPRHRGPVARNTVDRVR
jgi:hypothetical protein